MIVVSYSKTHLGKKETVKPIWKISPDVQSSIFLPVSLFLPRCTDKLRKQESYLLCHTMLQMCNYSYIFDRSRCRFHLLRLNSPVCQESLVAFHLRKTDGISWTNLRLQSWWMESPTPAAQRRYLRYIAASSPVLTRNWITNQKCEHNSRNRQGRTSCQKKFSLYIDQLSVPWVTSACKIDKLKKVKIIHWFRSIGC